MTNLARWYLPHPDAIGRLLRDLLGRPVTAKQSSQTALTSPSVHCTYLTDDGQLNAVGLLEFKLAAFMGAAMTMIPVRVAEQAIKSNQLDPTLLDNVREVMNVGSQWLMPAQAPHVVLGETHVGPLPNALATLIKTAPRALVVDLDIQGYGSGRLALHSL